MARKRRSNRAQFVVPVAALSVIALLVAGGFAADNFSVVSEPTQLAAAAGGAVCEPKYTQCLKQVTRNFKALQARCEQEFQKCVLQDQKCGQKIVLGSDNFSCNKNPDCQIHCTESWTSKNKSGSLVCCEGGAKHVNTCRDKVDGKCIAGEYKGTPKDQQGASQGKGGMPQIPMIPMPPPPMPPPPPPPQDQKCAQNPELPECKEANQPLYCNLPGMSLFSADCANQAPQEEQTQQTTAETGTFFSQFLGDSEVQTQTDVSDAFVPDTLQNVSQIAPQDKALVTPQILETSHPTQGAVTGFTPNQASISQEQRTAVQSILGNITARLKGMLSFLGGQQ